MSQANENEQVLTQAVLRKIKSESNSNEEWDIGLFATCNAYHKSEGDHVLNGFIEDYKINPSLQIKLIHKDQFDITHKIEPKNRMLHVDATGILFKYYLSLY
jgi:hypothetical protein